MKVKIIGKETVNYTDKKTGQPAQFGKIYCITEFPMDSNNPYEGMMAIDVSCSPSSLSKIPVNVIANMDFNQQGRLQSVDVIENMSIPVSEL